MNKLIITADDFGVYPSINAGITKSVLAGKVNSVAVLSNYGQSVENTLQLLDDTNGDADIGCHLTLTSGQPLSVEGQRMIANLETAPNFPPYTEFQKFDPKAVKRELNAQIDCLLENDIPVQHLSSHHNILTLFKEHFDVLMEISRKRKIPMRSPNIDPTNHRDSLYRIYVRAALIGDVTIEERREITRFGDEVHHYFLKNSDEIKAPDMLDSRHYGPLPFAQISERRKRRLIDKKHTDLDEFFDYYENTIYDTLELVMHLIEPDCSIDESVDYPGIETRYFDSRVVEFESLMQYSILSKERFTLTTWDSI